MCGPELYLHEVRFGRQSHPKNWRVVGLSGLLGPDELELPQQGHRDEEELHTSQTLTEAHAVTWGCKRSN